MPIRITSELYTQRQRDVYMGFDCCHILNGHKYTHGYSRRDRWDRNQKERKKEEDREIPSFPCNVLNYDDT